MAEQTDYSEWTLEELRAEATARELAGRSGMNKAELVAALEADDAAAAAEEEPDAGAPTEEAEGSGDGEGGAGPDSGDDGLPGGEGDVAGDGESPEGGDAEGDGDPAGAPGGEDSSEEVQESVTITEHSPEPVAVRAIEDPVATEEELAGGEPEPQEISTEIAPEESQLEYVSKDPLTGRLFQSGQSYEDPHSNVSIVGPPSGTEEAEEEAAEEEGEDAEEEAAESEEEEAAEESDEEPEA